MASKKKNAGVRRFNVDFLVEDILAFRRAAGGKGLSMAAWAREVLRKAVASR